VWGSGVLACSAGAGAACGAGASCATGLAGAALIATVALFTTSVALCQAGTDPDGVFLINQNVVTAASGFPYTIAVPGSYKLTGNLTVRPGVDAIDIVVPGVTLDLNGFVITCPGCTGASGAGINSTSAGTTVRNGTILGFHAGLVFTQGAAKVDLVTILGSGTSGYTVGILSYSDLRISNSSVSNNDYGVSSSGDLALTHSVIKQNYYGVSTQGDGLIVENVIQGNTVGLSGFAGSLFGSNVFSGNATNVSGGVSQKNNLCSSTTC